MNFLIEFWASVLFGGNQPRRIPNELIDVWFDDCEVVLRERCAYEPTPGDRVRK